MNPEVQQAINNINQYIVENHNNEITANILNPILIELANLFDLVGDLSELNTAEKDSIVSAINWLITQINSGAEIHIGTADPNVTPPDNYDVGDLYSRQDVLGNPYQIYMYNGVEWGEIKRVINDLIISTDSTWSSEKISQAIQGDRFDVVPTINISDNEITITNSSWWIQGVNYNLIPDFEDTIPYTSAVGMMRKDIVVAVAANNFVRIQGVESDTNPFEPTLPPNTLLVTSIDVFHDSIGEPTEPIVGNNYVTKTSQGWVGYQLNPSVLQATPTLGNIHSISFIPFTDGHFITGLNITSVEANKIWNGATFGIRNNSDNYPITLKNLHTGGGKILFNFPSGQDLILTKEMGIKYFKLGVIPSTGNAIAYCINDFKSDSDLTLEQARQNGNVLEGEVILESSIIPNQYEQWVIKYIDPNNEDNQIGIYVDDGNFSFKASDESYDVSFGLGGGGFGNFDISGNNPNMKGFVGNTEFDKQGDRKAFAQIADLEDALEDYIQEPATVGTSGQVLTTDGSGGRSWTTVSGGSPSADQVSYDNTASGLLAETVQEAVDEVNGKLSKLGFVQRTGTAIAFDEWATYGTYGTPVSGNLSYSFTNMVKGVIQVMYHEDSSAPALTQVGTTVIETGDYVVDNMNKITIHCIDENVVEVNIKAL